MSLIALPCRRSGCPRHRLGGDLPSSVGELDRCVHQKPKHLLAVDGAVDAPGARSPDTSEGPGVVSCNGDESINGNCPRSVLLAIPGSVYCHAVPHGLVTGLVSCDELAHVFEAIACCQPPPITPGRGRSRTGGTSMGC